MDAGREYQGGYSTSNALLFGVRREGSALMKGTAGFPVGGGLQLSSLMLVCSTLGVQERESWEPSDVLPEFKYSLDVYEFQASWKKFTV